MTEFAANIFNNQKLLLTISVAPYMFYTVQVSLLQVAWDFKYWFQVYL